MIPGHHEIAYAGKGSVVHSKTAEHRQGS